MKGNSFSVNNYRHISLINNFSKVFEFVVYDHMSRYFKHKLNPSQHIFSKAKSTTTSFVRYLHLFLLYLGLNVKLILFILTLTLHLTLSRIQFYFTNCAHALSDGY
jgi:hypothetical protein